MTQGLGGRVGRDIQGLLARTELFEGIAPDGLSRLIESGRVEYWPEGADLIEEGAAGPRLMVVIEGRCEVLRRDPSGVQRTLAEMQEGDVIGEMSLLLELPRTATVRALTDVRVFTMDHRTFQLLVDAGDPAALRFGLELAKVLAQRVQRLSGMVVDLLMQADGAEPLRQMFDAERDKILTLWRVD